MKPSIELKYKDLENMSKAKVKKKNIIKRINWNYTVDNTSDKYFFFVFIVKASAYTSFKPKYVIFF